MHITISPSDWLRPQKAKRSRAKMVEHNGFVSPRLFIYGTDVTCLHCLPSPGLNGGVYLSALAIPFLPVLASAPASRMLCSDGFLVHPFLVQIRVAIITHQHSESHIFSTRSSKSFPCASYHIVAEHKPQPVLLAWLARSHASGVRRLKYGCAAIPFGWINKRSGATPPQPYG